jgi:hypothetical protein
MLICVKVIESLKIYLNNASHGFTALGKTFTFSVQMDALGRVNNR